MDLSICIVSYNCRDLLAECLRSIDEHSGGLSVEVIVTDNASSDDTVPMVREQFPDVTLIANDENAGFAGGTNQAVAAASGEMLIMLNPDTEVRPGALERMVSFLRERPEVGAVGPAVHGPDGAPQSTCHPFPRLWRTFLAQLGLHRALPRRRLSSGQDARPRQVDWLSGVCMGTRRDVWEAVGPLDEGYFIYSEDVDWCYRLARAGYERWYLPGIRIVHHEAGSWAGASEERILAAHRANFRFFGKNYGRATEVAARVLVTFGALARGSLWTIAGPMVGDSPEVVTDHETHFRVAEMAIDMDRTWRRTEGRVS